MAETAAVTKTSGEHVRKRPYVWVFAILGIATVIEVNMPTIAAVLGLEPALYIIALFGFVAIKGSLVVGYYMHLRYEPRWLMLIPLASLALIGILVLALLGTPGLPAPP